MPSNSFGFWCSHFIANRATADRLPWGDTYRLDTDELKAIAASIQQFQLGEGSNGRRLLRRGLTYARKSEDFHFLRALFLFVKEEQRHSGYLRRFMQSQGIPELRKHWIDSVFRILRGLAGLELSLRVLVTAEIIAVPYYRALRDATKSPLLTAICTQILADEAAHLRFQAAMLQGLSSSRLGVTRWLVDRSHRLFLTGTSLIVWQSHGGVFRAAGYTMDELLIEAHAEFRGLVDAVSEGVLRKSGEPAKALR
jgi:hypothetical protein